MPKDKKFSEAKIRFFQAAAFRYLPQMRLLFRGGKLWKKDGWRNVAEHCLIQAVAAEIMGDLLKLPSKEIDKIARVAACHDWKKRLQKRLQDFSEKEKILAESIFRSAQLENDLFAAVTPEFNIRFLAGEVTFLEKIQWYIDSIAMGGKIVSAEQRIDEVEARRQDLNEDAELTRKLGGRHYWDVEREISHKIEQEIFELLRSRGVRIKTPKNIPKLINQEIRRKIMKIYPKD